MKSRPLIKKAKQHLKAFVPASVIQSQMHKRTFMQFAEKLGLVYFGYVDQRSDEHRLVRGLTVSASHRDNHYCVGTFHGYDMALIERVDTIRFPGKPTKAHDWIIMTFDLHASVDVPHVFVGLHTHSETFYAHLFTKFSSLAKAPLGTFGAYEPAFVDKYAVYTAPAQTVAIERLFDQGVAKTMARQFGSLTVEIADGSLYLYAEHQRPSMMLLEKMAKLGAWLAESIDQHLETPSQN